LRTGHPEQGVLEVTLDLGGYRDNLKS